MEENLIKNKVYSAYSCHYLFADDTKIFRIIRGENYQNILQWVKVTIDSELSFEKHICEKVIKANSVFAAIRRNFKYLNAVTFLPIYKTLVRTRGTENILKKITPCEALGPKYYQIRVITKLPNTEQSYKGKDKTHKSINRQYQSTTGKLGKPQWPWLGTDISKEMVDWIRFYGAKPLAFIAVQRFRLSMLMSKRTLE